MGNRDVIAVESPTYHRLLQIIEQLGMLAVEIETDPVVGMNLDSLQRALEAGISITPGTLFSSTPKYKSYIRICFSPPWSEKIRQAIKTLGKLALPE